MTMHAPDVDRRKEWVQLVTALADQVQQWALAEGWLVHRTQRTLREQLVGEYSVPMLQIRAPGGEMFLKPVAVHILGADGRVDLEAWPTLNRVKLVRRDNNWQIITDSNVPLRQPWDSQTFVQLVHDLQS
jgi:hypothetical protein